jgi:hypothetical protein
MSILNWFSKRHGGDVLAFGLVIGCFTGCGGSAASHDAAQSHSSVPALPDTLAAPIFRLAQDTVLGPLLADWPKVESKQERPGSEASDRDSETVAMVYRVQLYTTKDLSTAQAVGKEAKSDFGQDVQIDYEIPYYKVRVGVFNSPQAAEPVLQEARRLGYRGAWAVRMRASEKAP